MNETRHQALPVGTRIGVYEIRRVVGIGRFSITYQVWNQHLNAEMALKEYFPSDMVQRAADGVTVLLHSKNEENLFQLGLDKFSEDANKLVRIEHPHLQRVQNDLQIHGTVYQVMEYEDGIPLSRLIERSGAVLDEEQLKIVFLPLIEALGRVHEAGILHGNINPANILLRKSGESVLLDFSSTRLALVAPLGIALEVFSDGYAPVEQYDPQAQPGPWSDLYSLGATMYRCVTGNDPLSATDRLADVSKGKPDPQWPALEAAVAGYHLDFLKTIDWMLSIHAEDRPQSVSAVLESFKDQSDEEAEADDNYNRQSGVAIAKPQPTGSRRLQFPLSLLIFPAIAAVLLIATVQWYSGRDRRADEILAAAESHRLASLSRSEDEAVAPEPAPLPDKGAEFNAGEGELDTDVREGGVVTSDPQTPDVDRSQGEVDTDTIPDALAAHQDSVVQDSDPATETVAAASSSGDQERQMDTADTKSELVEAFESLHREEDFEIADNEGSMAETVPDSLSEPMVAPVQVIEENEQAVRPESTALVPEQGTQEGAALDQVTLHPQEQAQTEPSHEQKDSLPERDLPATSSPDLPQAVTRSAAEESAPPAAAAAEERTSVSRTQATPYPEPAAQPHTGVPTGPISQPDEAAQRDIEAPTVSLPPLPGRSQITEKSGQSSVSRIEASTLSSEDRIDQHMAAAEKDINVLRLSTPQGDNALEHYLAVLSLDSEHVAAQQGIRHIVEVYGWLIDRAIENDQLATAGVYLQRAEEIMPEAPELQRARTKLSTLQSAQEEESTEQPQ